MATGIVEQDQHQQQHIEKEIEKQMGCMAGFLQIFDRHQILTGKRLYSTKRLPPSTVFDSSSESDKAMDSPQQTKSMPSPVKELRSPVPKFHSKLPLPLPVLELKEGNKSSTSWKFSKEAPRLSLDSRATLDPTKGSLKPKEIRTNAAFFSSSSAAAANTKKINGGGEETEDNDAKKHRSPSVIARLMGLEKLPEWEGESTEQTKKPELRRSASESRANTDLKFQYRFIDGVNFQLKQSQQQQQQNNAKNNHQQSNVIRDKTTTAVNGSRAVDPKECNIGVRRAKKVEPNKGIIRQRKCFFDSADFFPEPKHLSSVSIYGELEKRLKMRGIDEPSKDLETLKQILEALQLKGLLHSNKELSNQRNFVYDNSAAFPYDESPIVVMKPARSTSPSTPVNRQSRIGIGNDSPPRSSFRPTNAVRRDLNAMQPSMNPRRENRANKNSISPARSESGSVKSPSRRKPLGVETQRRIANNNNNNNNNNSRVSPVQSPKVNSRKTVPDQPINRSPRNRKQTLVVLAEDESSSVSDSFSTSSQTDTEKTKATEELKEGKNLLERCDKLLHSIAEMTATNELQPSPVSVLDSSFYKEESSPSPVVMKRSGRSVDFKDQLAELEDDIWSPAISPLTLKSVGNSEDSDLLYISDILRASNYLPDDSDVFLLLEKQQYLKGQDTSKVSRLQRKLIFDTIHEILSRKRQLPPWKATICAKSSREESSLQQIWSEFQRIRERDASDDLLEVICGMLKKDLAGDAMNGWGDCPIEMSESVLDIERLIFKDLIGETIRDLAAFTGKCNQATWPRRKLVF